MKANAEKVFEAMTNNFTLDNYVRVRFDSPFYVKKNIATALEELTKFRMEKMISGIYKRASGQTVFKKSVKYMRPQKMRYSKLNKVGDKFTLSELKKNANGITKPTLKKWLTLGYINVTKTTSKETYYEKTLIWYLSQELLIPTRFKKTVLPPAKIITVSGSMKVITSATVTSLKTKDLTMEELLKHAKMAAVYGFKDILKTTATKAKRLATSKTFAARGYNEKEMKCFKEILTITRLVTTSIKA